MCIMPPFEPCTARALLYHVPFPIIGMLGKNFYVTNAMIHFLHPSNSQDISQSLHSTPQPLVFPPISERCVQSPPRWWVCGMKVNYSLNCLVLQSRMRAAGKKHPKKRGQRATSNIFAMFDQAQIQEFKEVCLNQVAIILCASSFSLPCPGFQHDRPEQRWFYWQWRSEGYVGFFR